MAETKSRHILSKSTYLYGCQCEKRLCLHKFHPELRTPPDESQQAVFQSGTDIGQLARSLYPGGVDASPPDPYSYHLSVKKTAALIAAGTRVIYEAAFQAEGLLCAVDILVNKKGRWYAYEVKGSTSVKDVYREDVAFQYYVMTQAGMVLHGFDLVYLNKSYVRQGKLDPAQLFSFSPELEEAERQYPNVGKKCRELIRLVKKRTVPEIDIGPHCDEPYSCDFKDYCWSHIPEDSVFDLRGRMAGKQFDLYRRGIIRLPDIPPDEPLPGAAAFQLEHYRSGTEYIDSEGLNEFLSQLKAPYYFLDFETYMTGVPDYDLLSPWQQVPFQFSLHVMKNVEAEPEHFAFLAEGKSDPREAFAQALLKLTGKKGSIIAWNSVFEMGRIRELARVIPGLEGDLEALITRFVDLMQPFRSRLYYHPAFNGSYSIKEVLPVLVPGLDYSGLEIGDGGTASMAFLEMRESDDAKYKSKIREALLQYCRMDTLAMVEILRVLKTKVQ